MVTKSNTWVNALFHHWDKNQGQHLRETFIKLISYDSRNSFYEEKQMQDFHYHHKSHLYMCVCICTRFLCLCVHFFALKGPWSPDSWGHLWDVVNVGQGELCLPRRVETSGAKPQPPKHSCDQQQDDQQPSKDKGLHRRDSACIYRQKDTGVTTLCIWIVYTYLQSPSFEDLKA